MKSKHPQTKKELAILKPKIRDELIKTGTTNIQMRQIANKLGIDAGLVVKVKGEMIYEQAQTQEIKSSIPMIIEREENMEILQDQQEKIEIVEEENKEEKIEEGKKKRKTRVTLTPEKEVELCNHYANKEFTQKELAIIYEISESGVSRIIARHGLRRKENNKNMGKKRKAMTRSRQRNNKENIAAKNVTTNIEEDDRLYPEEGGKNPNEPFATIRFVAYLPLANYEKEAKESNIIWAISKNADYHDLITDIKIMKKSDGAVINKYRDRYYLVSIVNGGFIHLIDYWDVTNETLSIYTSPEKYNIKDENGNFITYDKFNEIIRAIIKYDKSSGRSRLRLNDFVVDTTKFGELHRIFGLDNFSFNMASKENSVIIEAGLIAGRHDGMPVNSFIYEASFGEDLMFNYDEQERLAKKFLSENFDFSNDTEVKQLKLYVTGMQSAYTAVIKACVDMKVNLVSMHYNAQTKSYLPQYVTGKPEDCGAYVKAFEKLHNQKCLNGDVLLFNCTFEDFGESNIDKFYVMECAKMRNQNNNDNQKAESIIIIIKEEEDIWKIYPTIVKYINANTGFNLALWVTDAKIKDNNLYWGMNIVKSFNYK